MQVSFVSKNILLTEGLKNFIGNKLQKLSRYSSDQLSRVQVVLDVNQKRKGVHEDAVVEMVGQVKGKRIVVRDHDATFYKAFFGALSKMKTRIIKEVRQRR